MGEPWISASDVEKYGYCPLSWWLNESEKEVINESLKEGREEHKKITGEIDEVKEKEEATKRIENLILWLAVSATFLSIAGLTLIRPEKIFSQIFQVNALIWLLAATFLLFMSEKGVIKEDEFKSERVILVFAMVATGLGIMSITLPILDDYLARITQVISLIWLIGASYWLKRSLSLGREVKTKKEKLHMPDAEVDYVDLYEESSKMFASDKYRLRGRPDYVVKENETRIPVEIKTGRVPKGPFFSHILQVAAYCLLMEEDTGKAPPYGIVKYGEKEFEVEYDDSLKDLLIEKLEEMREIFQTEDVHRNHNRKGKCRNCSRREICPESLV
ncbi:MAG: CRISPR-associated protein Cas4 [Candidatus Saliniplasma sp.]